ncbi:putative polyketide biosynthesis zinc-dependent hydrolase BaeB [Sporocytophaga myxococcoides]|uniref:Putative polyketide biosynthesis zinc-dependent hydrolase BaeB n=1 Tax=Sporocytophaga myxococcoides TaxID=153721 RepID=A0A098LFF7_9BACT|nr:FAD/NAD(P)-binding protein [Sporocytophaga myxococcoides]GAL85209.1 putative polyketide biosynthesis zinc-dependent hydrolase BaeB [Sporocytophaga myxococcoides]
MKTISIVGGGFCGCMLTLHLLKKRQSKIKIHLIDKSEKLCKGAAYSTEFNFHLLNVNAGKMSALQSDEDNFINWLKENKYPYNNEDYVPRKLYGNYLSNLLYHELNEAPDNVDIHIEEAIDVTLENDKAVILLESGKKIISDKVVLAPGNFSPQSDNDPFEKYIDDGIYFTNPWNHQTIIDKIHKEEDILILGTGLTMIDLCTTLYFNSHKGKIHAFSRHGFLPAVHKPVYFYEPFYHEIEKTSSLSEVLSIVKKHLHSHKQQGGDWRDIIDSLRPYNQKIWMNFSTNDKALFIQKLNRLWSISRHRIPQEYQITIDELLKNNMLEIHSGKIDTIVKTGRKLNITVRKKNNEQPTSLSVHRVINCTGPQLNYLKLQNPLIKNMIQKGLIHPGPLNLGVDATPEGKVKNHYNENIIYALGSALTGVLFESTAVPELRVQAEVLADILLFSELPVPNNHTTFFQNP